VDPFTPPRRRPVHPSYEADSTARPGATRGFWPGLSVHSILARHTRMEAERVLAEASSQEDEGALDQLLNTLRRDSTRRAMLNEYSGERSSERRPSESELWFDQFPSSTMSDYRGRRRRDRAGTSSANSSTRVYPDIQPSRNVFGRSPSFSPTRPALHEQERARVERLWQRSRFGSDADSLFGDTPRIDLSNPFRRRRRSFGDYMVGLSLYHSTCAKPLFCFQRDEDFDSSYEGLLSLANQLGDVKPRGLPDHIIKSLPRGTYKDWTTTESDKRCPICLDDVSMSSYLENGILI
jgi:hypothetical protein